MKMKYIPLAVEKKLYIQYLEMCTHRTKSLNTEKRSDNIIVSLTSYPARFKYLYLVIESIFRQTLKPDRIILFLDEGVREENLPSNLLELKKYGLEIEIGGAPIKPHKKYYYAIKDNPDSVVITVDDDHVYRRDVVEKLINSYHQFPKAVSCMRAHRITFDANKKVMKYNEWEYECTDYINQPRMDLIATGIGAVLYPPKCMYKDIFDLDCIMRLSLDADDIWLKVMEVLNQTPVVAVEAKKVNPIAVDSIDVSPLAAQNVNESKNDVYLQNLVKKYGIDLYELISKSDSVNK